MRNICVIATGGTIDKIHDTRTEGLSFAKDGSTHITELLKNGRCYFPAVQLLMLKDSLDFDQTDREAIADAIRKAPEDAIVVTHGTGTMDQTARHLNDLALEKTIVLTGAMRPFSLFTSDGEFNLGGAIIAAQTLSTGVWGVMNGRVFSANELRKNVDEGRFDI